jgi:hypothetical protein
MLNEALRDGSRHHFGNVALALAAFEGRAERRTYLGAVTTAATIAKIAKRAT